jgi:serine/threonine protein phosphatase PrpC
VSAPPCPQCGTPAASDDRFCEECGTQLVVDFDGHDDRRAADAGPGAAVSDVGRVHHRNEDAFFVDADSRRVIGVVCDGVSSAVAPDVAARVAADTAGSVLRDGVGGRDIAQAMRAAIDAAQRAVQSIPWAPGRDRHAPSCTFVGAVFDGHELTVASVGDSRAYWIGRDRAAVLTRDDSWMSEQIAAGLLDEDAAAADPRAHMITNWLGADAPDDDPRVTSFVPEGTGRVVLCSDGLWNYASAPDEVAALVAGVGTDAPASAVADALVEFALDAGGRDNVTVAVLDVGPAQTADDGSDEEEHA